MTPSEKYVSNLCDSSFLPFWSFVSPLGKKGKELCDAFVVCDNKVILISVKEISTSLEGTDKVKYERWVKKAVYSSADQLYGAERFLKKADEVVLKDGVTRIKLPVKESREIYRLAIAFGSREDFPLPTGDFGKGFVHVFDELSTQVILSELDTITDFTNYLKAKEQLIKGKYLSVSREVDFLACYLLTEFKFSNEVVDRTYISINYNWEEYLLSEEYKIWRNSIKCSYVWDNFIKYLYEYHINDATSSQKRSKLEEAVRIINLEPRVNRIELGSILENAISKKVRARMLKPPEGCDYTYVFVPLTEKNWTDKSHELEFRCAIARAEFVEAKKIVGIAIGSNDKGESCFDICFLHIPELNNEFIEVAELIKEEFGYFKKQVITNSKSFRE